MEFKLASMFIMMIILIFKIVYSVLKNSLVLDFLLTLYFVGNELCYEYLGMGGWQSLGIGLMAAAAVLALMFVKYIRLGIFTGYGIFMGYEFYIWIFHITQEHNMGKVGLVLSAAIGIVFFVYHIYSGVSLGRKKAVNPIGWLYYKLSGKEPPLENGDCAQEEE